MKHARKIKLRANYITKLKQDLHDKHLVLLNENEYLQGKLPLVQCVCGSIFNASGRTDGLKIYCKRCTKKSSSGEKSLVQ